MENGLFGLVVRACHLQVLHQGSETYFSDKGEKRTESKTEKRNVCLIEKVNNTRESPGHAYVYANVC